jgi:hypothetical protein
MLWTENSVLEFVQSKNAEVISFENINKIKRVIIRCKYDNHIWSKKIPELSGGKWCLACSKRNREISAEKIKSLAELNGYELLTTGDITLNTRISLRCPLHDFVWNIMCETFKYHSKKSCRLCRSNAPYIANVKDFINKKNGTLISFSTPKTGVWYKIQCNVHKDSVWDTRWKTIINRHSWCRKCYYDRLRISFKEIKEFVENKNGTLLSNNCSGSLQKFLVQCNKCQHKWKTNWTILSVGSWCPKCAKLVPHTKEEITKLVSSHGGTLLSDVGSVREKIKILCKCGNIFSPLLGNLIRGSWCTACAERHKTQKKLFDIIKELFLNKQVEFNFSGFEWLKYTNKMQIDIWLPETKLAIEYDGKQHFCPVKFDQAMSDDSAQKAFKATQKRDRKKNKLIKEHPDDILYFIRFNYKQNITKELVISELNKAGIII